MIALLVNGILRDVQVTPQSFPYFHRILLSVKTQFGMMIC